MANNTDQKTLDLIQEVNKRKEEIQRIEKPSWATNCSFQLSPSRSVNLHVVSDVNILIEIQTILFGNGRDHKWACSELGITDAVFLHQGFTYDQWTEDVKLRLAQIQVKEKKQKLEALESRLNSIISPEKKREMELEAIVKELG